MPPEVRANFKLSRQLCLRNPKAIAAEKESALKTRAKTIIYK